jgi:hypothetical protein
VVEHCVDKAVVVPDFGLYALKHTFVLDEGGDLPVTEIALSARVKQFFCVLLPMFEDIWVAWNSSFVVVNDFFD